MVKAPRRALELPAFHTDDLANTLVRGKASERIQSTLVPRAALHEDSAEMRSVGANRLADGLNPEHETRRSGNGVLRLFGARLHEAARAASEISPSTARAAAAGSDASRIGRPTTRMDAPSRIASRGVPVRFWSPRAAPDGRMPGVTRTASGPTAVRTLR